MSADLLKYVTPEGVEHTLNLTNTNIDDSKVSSITAWSSLKTQNEIESSVSTAKGELEESITALQTGKAEKSVVDTMSVQVENLESTKSEVKLNGTHQASVDFQYDAETGVLNIVTTAVSTNETQE